MKKASLFFILSCLSNMVFAQNVYTIKADSVKITNCDSAELIIENHTQNVPGFLFNTGNGRTVFKKALSKINDSLYLIGTDTLKVLPAGNVWSVNGNAGTVSGTNFIGTTDNVPLNFRVNNISAGRIDTTGLTFLGYRAGMTNTTGIDNTAVGYGVLQSNTTGKFNTAVGYNALAANTTGQQLTAFGYNALAAWKTQGAPGNTAIGYRSLGADTTGIDNTAVGYASLAFNTTGGSNTSVGIQSLSGNTTGSNNTAMGSTTLQLNTTGSNNTAMGSSALVNSTGSFNTAVGSGALFNNGSGSNNTAVGYNALRSVTTISSNNTGIGDSVGYTTTGSGNTYVGYKTGIGIVNGFNNTIIGANIAGLSSTLSNNILLADGSGNIRFDAFSTGNVAIGSTTDNGNKLQINGSSSFSDSVILNKVTNGDSTDSVLVWHAATHAIHKVAQSVVGGSAFNGMLNSSLAVNGTISAKKLQLSPSVWPDYVFDSSYRLLPIDQLEKYIRQNNHLPGIPAAMEVEKKGLDVGANQAALLKKIEELTLYNIAQEKRLDEQEKKMDGQAKEMESLKTAIADLKKMLVKKSE